MLPIRCLIERIPAPGCHAEKGNSGGGGRPTSPSSPPGAPDASSSTSATAASSPGNSLEHEAYVIIPNGVAASDLVRTALFKLGYPPSEAVGAKGWL